MDFGSLHLLLLNSLSDEYDHLTTTLLHGKDTITFDAVCSAFYRSETRKKDKRDHKDTIAEALTTRNRSHSNKPGRRGKSKERPTKDELEHDEESDFRLVGMAMTCHTNEWILDWGCTYHMCPNKDWFSSLKKLEGGVVFMGNDSVCKKIRVGTIQLKNHDSSIQVLTYVRYILNLKKNPISLGALESKGLTITLRDELLKVLVGELTVMKGTRRNNLYYLNESIVIGSTLTVSTKDTDSEATRLWHIRLGHAGEKALQTLAKQGLLRLRLVERSNDFDQTMVPSTKMTHFYNYVKMRALYDTSLFGIHHSRMGWQNVELEKVNDDPANIGGTNDEEVPTQEPLQQQDSIAYKRPRREIRKPNRFDNIVAYALPIIEHDVSSTYTEAISNLNGQKGYTQKEGIGYNEVFSPVVKHSSIQILLALVAQYDFELVQLDVKTAFLHGDLEEEIYMTQPDGFKKLQVGTFIYLLLYVDNMLIASNSKVEIERLKTQLNFKFEMKILSMEICRDRVHGRVSFSLSQKKYLKKVLQQFGMNEQTKLVCTLLTSHFKLFAQLSRSTNMKREYMLQISYSNAVGSLMYAMACTRPDISQVVSIVSRYMHNPRKGHWQAVKWILRYIQKTVDVGLLFKQDNTLGKCVIGYVDSDYAGDLDKQKSTTGYVFTLARGPISWKSTLQSTVALSTTEAEYMAVTEAVKEAIWLQGMGLVQEHINVYCDR
ncbi:hypothetical protein CXB51_024910 [Gossypium anomalum]|uniref:Reverse transcriptase Ty1/copia-type domain-containing protein n=1 Tax=Gossypium anomalum TaxID=47600 RepID=A0A8J5Y2F1_9ROSI|nr:hypothetical protein CXB51_024910 [Gossypium anomalum]